MTTINLKDFYPWYMTDEHIEVSDEVAAELRASKLAEAAYAERVRYNKAYYYNSTLLRLCFMLAVWMTARVSFECVA
jgi:hypothetical protein